MIFGIRPIISRYKIESHLICYGIFSGKIVVYYFPITFGKNNIVIIEINPSSVIYFASILKVIRQRKFIAESVFYSSKQFIRVPVFFIEFFGRNFYFIVKRPIFIRIKLGISYYTFRNINVSAINTRFIKIVTIHRIYLKQAFNIVIF